MIRLLGSPTVDGTVPLKARMAYVAAAMLDLTPARRLPRAILVERLWPSAGAAAGHNNLRQLLSEARAWDVQSGRRLFDADAKSVWRTALCEPSDVWILQQIAASDTEAGLRRLDDLYGGDFLKGIDDLGGDTALWLMSVRERLRMRFVTLAVRGALRVRGEAAARILERASRAAPYDEEVVRAQLVVAAAGGRPGEAKRIYESLALRLDQELGATPEPATTQLLAELRAPALAAAPRPALLKPELPRVLILPPNGREPGQPADLPLVEALIDDVTHALSSARTFAVFAPHTARRLAVRPFADGNPYGADYLVATTLVSAGPAAARLRFTVTDLADHRVLLSEEIDYRHDDPQPSRNGLVAGLVSRLTQQIEQRELEVFWADGTPSAYVGYLLGSEELRQVDLRAVRRARKHFQSALKDAPHFARARAMLARTYSLEFLLLGRHDQRPLDVAMEHARSAIETDAADPVPRLELGHALIYLDRLDEAVDHLESAADRGPHYADVLCTFADSLVHVARNTEARDVMDRAIALNPLPPDTYHWTSATSHFMLGDYEAAKSSIGRMAFPASAGRIMAASEALSGNREAAFHHRDLFMAENPNFSLDNYVFPVRNPNKDHLIGGMRAAGFS